MPERAATRAKTTLVGPQPQRSTASEQAVRRSASAQVHSGGVAASVFTQRASRRRWLGFSTDH